LDAGRAPKPGLYLVDRVVNYEADELRDRNGNVIPTASFNMHGLSNATGIAYTFRLPGKSVLWTASAAGPVARLRLNVHDHPEASFDRFGLTDFYLQPVRLAWTNAHFDAVALYGIYLPSGKSPLAGGKGLSQGHVTHEFSLGGTIYGGSARNLFATALASYDLNLRKHGIDITRGDTVRIQGGSGITHIEEILEFGVAAYALWQVRPDRGADLPPIAQGLRDRVYGVGPEGAVMLKGIRAQVRARYEWDLGAHSRPQGNVFVAGIHFLLKPPPPPVTP
jgi:hypothetical protein